MGVYNLDSDEAVVMQVQHVSTGSFGNVSLILTNKSIIQVNKGFWGGDKGVEKYPLEKLKIYNGKANVMVGKDHSGNKQLELYFESFEKFYRINGLMAENKWATAIIKAHKQLMDDIAKKQKSEAKGGGMFKTISGTIDSAKEKVSSIRQSGVKIIKCTKCGAELTGAKGTSVRCEYCNSLEVIK